MGRFLAAKKRRRGCFFWRQEEAPGEGQFLAAKRRRRGRFFWRLEDAAAEDEGDTAVAFITFVRN